MKSQFCHLVFIFLVVSLCSLPAFGIRRGSFQSVNHRDLAPSPSLSELPSLAQSRAFESLISVDYAGVEGHAPQIHAPKLVEAPPSD
ncbi:hypothetical protein TRIUR3_19739 [Triticum urartu]|uniref:Uncharacterized protein n=1 Tax=Triticum urartu TaxID=4572 RepID=M7Z1Q2_TRIUA|nr:hypothetical protein TRIUR3_19739 [Triticum urartu]